MKITKMFKLEGNDTIFVIFWNISNYILDPFKKAINYLFPKDPVVSPVYSVQYVYVCFLLS